jgi:hypothetical protein
MNRFLYVTNFIEMVTVNNIQKVVSQIALHESDMTLFSDCKILFWVHLGL